MSFPQSPGTRRATVGLILLFALAPVASAAPRADPAPAISWIGQVWRAFLPVGDLACVLGLGRGSCSHPGGARRSLNSGEGAATDAGSCIDPNGSH